MRMQGEAAYSPCHVLDMVHNSWETLPVSFQGVMRRVNARENIQDNTLFVNVPRARLTEVALLLNSWTPLLARVIVLTPVDTVR